MRLILTIFLLCLVSPTFSCVQPNTWLIPGGKSIPETDAISQLEDRNRILLIGEHHANAAHHQWHLELIKKLYSRNPEIIIGVEVFPRSKQSILDAWTQQHISEQEFLSQIDWDENWGFDLSLYMPLFRWLRENKIPMIAINVERSLIQKIKQGGLSSVPSSEREQVSDPAKPSREYVAQLARSFREHGTQYTDKNAEQIAFLRFVEQQLFWDRAMAQSLHESRQKNPKKLVVGIAGSWHLIRKHGIPYQLTSLGSSNTTVVIPWDEHLECNELQHNFSDLIFLPQ